MGAVSDAPRPRVWLSMTLGVLLCAVVGLLYLASIPAASRLAADPIATTIAPDCRLGFAGLAVPPTEATLRAFRAGVYYNYGIDATPQIMGEEHIQLVRIHNKMQGPTPVITNSGTPRYYWGTPYMLTPDDTGRAWEYWGGDGAPAATQVAAIRTAAAGDRGTLWLIGNEIDHPDKSIFGVSAAWSQDATVPEVYARAYKTISETIRAVDPSAQIAPGSVLQWTAMREAYYDQVLAAYKAQNDGASMPVDWWNVHVYIESETYYAPQCNWCYGPNNSYPPGYPTPDILPTRKPTEGPPPTASTPTPIPSNTPTSGPGPTATLTPIGWPDDWVNQQVNSENVKKQIIQLRRWLKDNGYQNKPLLVSEFRSFRPLYEYPPTTITPGPTPTHTSTPRPVVTIAGATEQMEEFLVDDLISWMLTYTDPEIGYPYDGYHLVQGFVYFGPAWAGNDNDWRLWHEGLNNTVELTVLGRYWIDYMNSPDNKSLAWPCQFRSTPRAWGPGAYGDGAAVGSDSGNSQSYNNGGPPDGTGTPEVTDTPTPTPPDAYPGP